MADLARVAPEILEVLKTFDYTVLLYDDDEMRVVEPEEALRFFDKTKNLMVALVDKDDNSAIELSYGRSTHANDIVGLVQSLKTLATKSALLFSAEQFGKQIKPHDDTTLGSIPERQDRNMILSLTEGMYGTGRSSYLNFENARMVVRHKKKINADMIGARGRYVESIFIENASGERLLFPSTQVAPARAMTQHVNQGGNFTDPLGGQIMQMTTEYANLSQASNFVGNNAVNLAEGAMAVREACRGKMRKFRKTFEHLSRASSYAKESSNVLEQASALIETGSEIDETRISELRQLLNDADLPRQVYECASKAMNEMKQDAPMTEALGDDEDDPSAGPEDIAVSGPVSAAPKRARRVATSPPKGDEKNDSDEDNYVPNPSTTVGVLGYRVDVKAWEKLDKENKLFVTGPPQRDDDEPAHFADAFSELCYKLGKWVPLVADVTLANLLSHVVDKLTVARATGEFPSAGISLSVEKQQSWKRDLREMVKIAVKAMQARKIKFAQEVKGKKKTEDFGAGVPAVVEHFSWLNRFSPNVILAEDFGMGDLDNGYDTTKNDIIAKFDAHDFAMSPEVHEVVGDRDHQNPEQNHLEHDEVMSMLRAYIERQINDTGAEDSFSLYMTDVSDEDEIADSLYDDACEALQHDGWIVQTTSNVDEADEIDDDALGMEDILIPTPDQGKGLMRQVSMKTIHDPNTDNEEPPDASYISRLKTLAGVQNGGQAY